MDLVWTMTLPLLYLWIVIILMDFGCIALYVWTLDMSYVLNGVFVIVLWSYIYMLCIINCQYTHNQEKLCQKFQTIVQMKKFVKQKL